MGKKLKPAKSKLLKRIQQQKRDLIIALEKSLGIVTPACAKAGLDRGTFYIYYNTDKSFRESVDSIRDKAIDFVETKAFARVRAGSDTMIIFMLKCLGKKRGYIERQEITGADGSPLMPTNISVVSQSCKVAVEKVIVGDRTA